MHKERLTKVILDSPYLHPSSLSTVLQNWWKGDGPHGGRHDMTSCLETIFGTDQTATHSHNDHRPF